MRKKGDVKMKKNMIRDLMQCVEWWGVNQTGAPRLSVIYTERIKHLKH